MKSRLRILVFGNPLIRQDSIPVRLLPGLRKAYPEIEFREFDAVEDLENEGRELVILDTVHGIEKVTIFRDLDHFSDSPRYSVHDFDLLAYLRLLKKAGVVKKTMIIGIPPDKSESEAYSELERALAGLLKKPVRGRDGC